MGCFEPFLGNGISQASKCNLSEQEWKILQQDVLRLIKSAPIRFSKGQRLIADYIVTHYDKAAFMTAAKLGKAVGVSESTVVRFAMELGYDGYPELQRELKEMIRNKLTSVQRIEISNQQIGMDNVLNKVLEMDADRIRKTLEATSKEDFNAAADAIVKARNIYIIGAKSAAVLARFLAYYFNLIFINVKLVHTTSASEMFEQILRIDENDVLIGISFPRYLTSTVKAFRYAKDNGATVVAITDSEKSPLTQEADHFLLARSDMASFVDSLVAPLSLINALIVAVGLKRQQDISETFSKLEGIWDEYGIYETTASEDETNDDTIHL